MESYRYVIIGNGAAGTSACTGIRQHDPSGSIIIIAAEDASRLSRAHLSYLLAGQMGPESLVYQPSSIYARENVATRFGRKVVRLDTGGSTVTLDDGTTIHYERLLFATGSRPASEDIPGTDLKGCVTFWDIADVGSIRDQLNDVKDAVILGGGPIGVKMTEAFSNLGIRCTLVVSSDFVLSQMLDPRSAEAVEKIVLGHKVQVIKNMTAARIEGSRAVEKVVLQDGRGLPCQMVALSKGVVPNMELAREAGIQVRRGIIVDNGMRTSVPNVFAAGDVAELLDPVTGKGKVRSLWAEAMRQGQVAGENMAGAKAVYDRELPVHLLMVYGNPVVTVGRYRQEEGEIVMSAEGEGWYRRIVMRDGPILGAVLVGEVAIGERISALIDSGEDASELVPKMLDPTLDPEVVGR